METARIWVLMLHSIFHGNVQTTVTIPGYTLEECHHAARYYEAQARPSVHYGRLERVKVWRAMAACASGKLRGPTP